MSNNAQAANVQYMLKNKQKTNPDFSTSLAIMPNSGHLSHIPVLSFTQYHVVSQTNAPWLVLLYIKVLSCTQYSVGCETAYRRDYYLSGGLNSFLLIVSIPAGKHIFKSGFLFNIFLLDKNYSINIDIILLGHKTLVCYLYLMCL